MTSIPETTQDTTRSTLGQRDVPLWRRGKPDRRQRFRALAMQLFHRRKRQDAYSRWRHA